MSTKILPESVTLIVQEQANAMYDGVISSADAFAVIDRAALSSWNYYDGILNDAHAAFQRQLDRRIDAALAAEQQPVESYEAKELRKQLVRGPYAGEDFFRLKVTGNGESRWINVTREQLDAIATVLA
jgi:hypothetical protein